MSKNILILPGSPRTGGNIARFLNWKGRLPGLHGKDDILSTDGLERAEELGKSIR